MKLLLCFKIVEKYISNTMSDQLIRNAREHIKQFKKHTEDFLLTKEAWDKMTKGFVLIVKNHLITVIIRLI